MVSYCYDNSFMIATISLWSVNIARLRCKTSIVIITGLFMDIVTCTVFLWCADSWGHDEKFFPDAVAAAKNVTELHGCTYAWTSFMVLLKRCFNIHISSGLALEMGKYFTKRNFCWKYHWKGRGSNCPIVRGEGEVAGEQDSMLKHWTITSGLVPPTVMRRKRETL